MEDSVFYKPFVNMSDTITAEQRATLMQQAQERIKQDLIPSLKEIQDFLVTMSRIRTLGTSRIP
ncbi:hypothetical protein E2C01_063942 [Portunus trituberculatus]|uniref:Uncharacterized protein n=1 Tax=Portunus trituberculatus TaxID=210409 RepID=A0A5B7HAH2_PORTR|nr:hypothetical protein [Portunus trituberculatus]